MNIKHEVQEAESIFTSYRKKSLPENFFRFILGEESEEYAKLSYELNDYSRSYFLKEPSHTFIIKSSLKEEIIVWNMIVNRFEMEFYVLVKYEDWVSPSLEELLKRDLYKNIFEKENSYVYSIYESFFQKDVLFKMEPKVRLKIITKLGPKVSNSLHK